MQTMVKCECDGSPQAAAARRPGMFPPVMGSPGGECVMGSPSTTGLDAGAQPAVLPAVQLAKAEWALSNNVAVMQWLRAVVRQQTDAIAHALVADRLRADETRRRAPGKEPRYWPKRDKDRFLRAVLYLRAESIRQLPIDALAEYIGTKSKPQIRSHAQKFFKRRAAGVRDDGVVLTDADRAELRSFFGN